MTIPYTFAGATTAIPLANLDANFASPITLGNVAMTLSNTYTSIGNLTLTNVTISSTSTPITVPQGGTGLTSLTAGYIPFGNGTSAFSSSANLFWDNTNGRLGIGTSSPTYQLDVINSGSGIRAKNPSGASLIAIDCANSAGSGYAEIQYYIAGTTIWSTGIRAADGNYYIYKESGSGNIVPVSSNIQFQTSGNGVQFSNSSALTNSTLNDYETGTFTPSYNGINSNPTVVYSTQQGYYTKIGNVVFVTIRITITSASGGSGGLRIGGLPFNQGSSGGAYPSCQVGYKAAWSTNGPDYGRFVATNIELYKSNNTNETSITPSNLTVSTDLIMSGSYIAPF